MSVESRDSVSLKPAELDEVGQIFQSNGLPISDEELDRQVESFPLAVLSRAEGDIDGLMLGSLERIGGTPSILWGMGVVRKGKLASATLKSMTGELTRRAAISFPDEDVLVARPALPAQLLRPAQSYATSFPVRVHPTVRTVPGAADWRSATATTVTSTIGSSRSRSRAASRRASRFSTRAR